MVRPSVSHHFSAPVTPPHLRPRYGTQATVSPRWLGAAASQWAAKMQTPREKESEKEKKRLSSPLSPGQACNGRKQREASTKDNLVASTADSHSKRPLQSSRASYGAATSLKRTSARKPHARSVLHAAAAGPRQSPADGARRRLAKGAGPANCSILLLDRLDG